MEFEAGDILISKRDVRYIVLRVDKLSITVGPESQTMPPFTYTRDRFDDVAEKLGFKKDTEQLKFKYE